MKPKYSIKEIIYYLFHRLPYFIWGKYIKHNIVNVHWGKGLKNFGDCLQPHILKHYGLTPYFVTNNNKSDVVLCGSILQWISSNYRGYIIGTGGENKRYKFPQAKILAVRGELTKKNLELNTDCILGDIGLIMPLIFNEPVDKIYNLGIVPHFTDYNNPQFRRLSNHDDVLYIDVLQSPKEVITAIRQCRHIASSSLHGLIIAEAYHIPTLRLVSYDTFTWKDPDFKYYDHYSALGIEMVSHTITGEETIESIIEKTTLKPIGKIEQIIRNLDSVMKKFAKDILSNQYIL